MNEYDGIGFTPGSRRISEKFGGWNNAKEEARLETYSWGSSPSGTSGYSIIHGENGESVINHRVMATLLVDDIRDLRDKHVHHKDGISWCDWLENLMVVDPGEHHAHHRRND